MAGLLWSVRISYPVYGHARRSEGLQDGAGCCPFSEGDQAGSDVGVVPATAKAPVRAGGVGGGMRARMLVDPRV